MVTVGGIWNPRDESVRNRTNANPIPKPSISQKRKKRRQEITRESKSGENKKSDKKSVTRRAAPVVQQLNKEIKKQESVMAELLSLAPMLVASGMSMTL